MVGDEEIDGETDEAFEDGDDEDASAKKKKSSVQLAGTETRGFRATRSKDAAIQTSMSDNKSDTRYVVAYYYLVFSAWQILLLLIAGQLDFSYNLVTPVISVAVYLVLGKRAFRSASEPAYRSLFMAFMAAYGTALLIV